MVANNLNTWRKMIVNLVQPFAPILYALEYIADDGGPFKTFYVEPLIMRIHYNAAEAAKRSPTDNAFMLAHEAGHVLCRHLDRRLAVAKAEGPSFIPLVFMMAEEMAVNQLVTTLSRWPVPNGCVTCAPAYTQMRTEQIYAELKKTVKIIKVPCGCIRPGPGGTDESKEMIREQAIASAKYGLNKQQDEQPSAESGELQRIITNSNPYKEPASLKQLLRRYLIAQDNNCKHFDPSTLYKRRLAMDGLALPNLSSSPIARKFVVSVDNSGSVGDVEFAEFKSILHSVAMQLGFQEIIVQHFTTQVMCTERYFDIRNLKRMDRQATGGTAIDEVDTRAKLTGAQFHIILTDGYVNWLPSYSLPTMVIITRANCEVPKTRNLIAALPLLP